MTDSDPSWEVLHQSPILSFLVANVGESGMGGGRRCNVKLGVNNDDNDDNYDSDDDGEIVCLLLLTKSRWGGGGEG